jgi:hypothetical protein
MKILTIALAGLRMFSIAALVLSGALAQESPAPDNVLTASDQKAGWQLLFDGRSHAGWMNCDRSAPKTPVADGTLNPHKAGAYMLVHEKQWGDFVLALDFKLSKGCNSGIFIRTSPLEPRAGKDIGFNGLEIALDDTTKAGLHDTGALYDLIAPTRNAMKPIGEWNHIEVTARGAIIEVVLNGEKVTRADLDQFTEKNKRPDGTAHKFDIAYRDHPRTGYIGLQDHGSPCWYRNIKLRPL